MSLTVDGLYVDLPHMVVAYDDLANLLLDYSTKSTGGGILMYAIQWVRDKFRDDHRFYGECLAMRLDALQNIAPELPPDVCRRNGKRFEFSPDLLAAVAVTPLVPSGGQPVPNGPCAFEKEKLLHNARVYMLRQVGVGDSKGKPS